MVDLGSAVKGGVWGPTKITRLKRTSRNKKNKGTNFGSIHKAAWSLMRDKRECDEIQGNGAMAQLRLHRNRWQSGHWAETFLTQLRWRFKLESVQALFIQWLGSGASSSATWSCKYAIGYFASFLTPELLAGIGELRARAFVAQAFQPMGGWSVARRDEAMRRLMFRPTDLVASHFCRAFLEAEKAVGMLAEEVWGEVSNDNRHGVRRGDRGGRGGGAAHVGDFRFLAGPVTQAVWPTMLLDPFFHLPNLRDEWDHLGSAHSLEVMSLTSMMQRSLLPNVLNNRARDMMMHLLARLHPTEELDAVLEFIEYVGGFRSAPL
ncbi:hypothetical protein B0H14DRAFT_3573754 [Mycena olivaceomarginata]|nr:hypothetical protein B0H14DRAFT_3573754 [Mycena olivaceomarginata]